MWLIGGVDAEAATRGHAEYHTVADGVQAQVCTHAM